MVLRKTKGYQDIDGSTVGASNSMSEPIDNVAQNIEMASVSVVPDGNLGFSNLLHLEKYSRFRYIYGYPSS